MLLDWKILNLKMLLLLLMVFWLAGTISCWDEGIAMKMPILRSFFSHTPARPHLYLLALNRANMAIQGHIGPVNRPLGPIIFLFPFIIGSNLIRRPSAGWFALSVVSLTTTQHKGLKPLCCGRAGGRMWAGCDANCRIFGSQSRIPSSWGEIVPENQNLK